MAIETLACSNNTAQHLVDDVKQLSDIQQATLIQCALQCLESRLQNQPAHIDGPQSAKDYVRLALGAEKNEVLGVMFLNNRHQLIAFEKLFRGTINTCSVYPRVIVQHALKHNAATVIFAHNHPSGDVQPSKDDIVMTETLVETLKLVDIRVLDHIIVSLTQTYSFAETGTVL